MRETAILLVEDNPDDEELTVDAFRTAKVSNPIVLARDGAEALDFLFGTGGYAGRELGALPPLILLDLNLPKLSGLEVLSRLRADSVTKRIPVIILTNSLEEQEVFEAYEKGCNSYVRRPVDWAQFREAVNQLGLFWLIHNVPPPDTS